MVSVNVSISHSLSLSLDVGAYIVVTWGMPKPAITLRID